MDKELDNLLAACGKAVPKYYTKPTAGAKHLLAEAKIIAAALGKPLLPWQELATRIITEKDSQDPRRFRWNRIILTTPRQVGKTTLYSALQTLKCVLYPGRQAFYTAQTGKDARARWLDLVKILENKNSPFRNDIAVKKGAGDSALTFSNGSSIAPFAPTAESLHGYTPHDVAIDEAFKFSLEEGTDLEGAAVPSMQTRVDRQLIVFSTAGNADSRYLKALIDRGRQSLENPLSETAYLEWSMPEGADPDSPDSWDFHPGLGHLFELRDMQTFHEDFKDKPNEWLRAYMNVWTESSIAGMFTPQEIAEVVTNSLKPPSAFSQVAISYEIAPDRSRSVIAAAWYSTDKKPCVRIVERFAATDGLMSKLAEIHAARPLVIGADDGGANRAINDKLKIEGKIPIYALSRRDYATGCEAFKAAVLSKKIFVDDDPLIIETATNAVMRASGQGWLIDRQKSSIPVPDLIACVTALRLLEQSKPPAPKPIVRFN